MPGAHPYSLRNTLTHPLARMLPIWERQMQVYRMAEKHPPSEGLGDHGPMWEAVSFVLAARDTLQARVNLQRNFTLLALTTSASVTTNGGFRAQYYDTKKNRRFADRNVASANIGGKLGPVAPPGAFFLREPYTFDQPDSQIMVSMQNLETSANTVQITFYGVVLRFNEAAPGRAVFPGGPVASAVCG